MPGIDEYDLENEYWAYEDNSGVPDVRRTLYDKVITGGSKMRPISNWEYRKVAATSDIPGYGSAKKIGAKVIDGLNAVDLQLQEGTRLLEQQVPYDEYSYEVYLDGTTFEPVTHRFNIQYEDSGWQAVDQGATQIDTTYRVCIGAGALCTK